MTDIDGFLKLHRVDRTVRVAVVVVNKFQNPCSSEPMHRFGVRMFLTVLRQQDRIGYVKANLMWEGL